jgi:flagellar protein FliO/FliZ
MILFRVWQFATTVLTPDDASPAELEPSLALSTGDYGLAFVKMMLTLFALAALLFGTLWFLRKIIQQRLQKGPKDSSIVILEKRMISPKTMLYLVEIENKKVLLAESHLEIKRIESFDRVP